MICWVAELLSWRDINSHLPVNSSRLYRVTSSAACGLDQKWRSRSAVGDDETKKNITPAECSESVFEQ